MSERNLLEDKRRFSLKAVIIGLLVDIIGTTIIGVLIGIIAGIIIATSVVSPEEIGEKFSNFTVFKIVLLLNGLFFSAFGGYLAARIAKISELKHSFITGVLSVLTGILFLLIMPEMTTLDWSQIASLLLTIPFALIGGYVRMFNPKKDNENVIYGSEKRKNKKRILIGCSIAIGSIIILAIIVIFFFFRYFPKVVLKMPSDLKNPAVLKGSGFISKSIFSDIFLRANQIGDVS